MTLSEGGPSISESHGIDANTSDVGDLATLVLDIENERESGEASSAAPVLFADDLLPGVGTDEMSLRDGLRTAGSATLVVLVALSALDQLTNSGLSVLAPNIRDTLHISNGTIVFISSAAGGFLVLGALPMGWLADRYRRPPIIAWASIAFSVLLAVCGLAVNAFMLFWAQLGVGVSKANTISVQWSLLADQYPIGVRGRMSAALNIGTQSAGAISPLLMAGIATLAGGTAGWRWAFVVLAIPVAVAALFAFRLPEPVRGQYEKSSVLGTVIDDENPAPISVEAAFARIRRVKTLMSAIIGFAALGFVLFTGPVLSNLFLQQHYHLDTFYRGLVATIGAASTLAILPFAGKRYDRLYRTNPSKAVALLGVLILPAAVLTPIQYFMPNWQLYLLVAIPQIICFAIAFTMCGPIFQSVIPYRLRGIGSALAAIYIFFIGATGGALIAAFLTNEYGPRVAMISVTVPATLIGGLFIMRSSRTVREDLSLVVAELQEEMAEHERQGHTPNRIPVLQVNNIDFSYGQVQVLHDVGFEVYRGEIVALLGTNGAGKSSILRVIAGLGTASRGVVRLNGRTISYVSPEQRVALGIDMLPGGKAVFPTMTVAENLEMGAYNYRKDRADRDRRIAKVLDLFPALGSRLSDRADSLSGGQQQMLGLARSLMHDPEILLIDELSLGLAPIVVQEMIRVLETLKDEGMTMVIVEQSVDVALAIASRAIFLEKGEVKFVGPAEDLLQRDDLLRAVFLGLEGG
jgi:ABC-type branched-subunit amino acid transport system ATPase component/predicted MFS family arabinose efflux permease